jgi:hypothetical protein
LVLDDGKVQLFQEGEEPGIGADGIVDIVPGEMLDVGPDFISSPIKKRERSIDVPERYEGLRNVEGVLLIGGLKTPETVQLLAGSLSIPSCSNIPSTDQAASR